MAMLAVIGAGEVGHFVLRELTNRGMILFPLVVVDGDIIEPRNPSYRGTQGYKAVVAAGEVAAQTRRPIVPISYFAQVRDKNVIYVLSQFTFPAQVIAWQKETGALVIETVDNVDFFGVEGIHIHTGMLPRLGAFWQIWTGSRTGSVVLSQQEDVDCPDALSEAAQEAARALAEVVQQRGWGWRGYLDRQVLRWGTL